MRAIAALLAVAAIGGSGLGEAVWKGAARHNADKAPEGWQKQESKTPYRLAALQGDLTLGPEEWALDFYRGVSPPNAVRALGLTTSLPEDGQIEIWLSSPPDRKEMMQNCNNGRRDPRCKQKKGAGVIIDNVDSLRARAISYTAKGQQEIQCSPPLAQPNSDVNRIDIENINGQMQVNLNGSLSTCSASIGRSPPMIRPGIREVHIKDLNIDGVQTPYPNLLPRWFFWIIGAVLTMGASWLESRKRTRLFWTSIGYAPLLFCWYLASVDLRGTVEALRASWAPWQTLPYAVPLLLFGLIKTTHMTAIYIKKGPILLSRQKQHVFSLLSAAPILMGPPLSGFMDRIFAPLLGLILPSIAIFIWGRICTRSKERTHLALLAIGGLSALLIGLTGPIHIWASLWAYAGGIFFGLLIAANVMAAKVKHYNWVCLVSVVMMTVAAEGVLRGTVAGRQWSNKGSTTVANDEFGWASSVSEVSTANEEFEMLSNGVHTTYPNKGYPVAIEARVANKKRVVSFGGSSTGGAWQNDNLDDFYPALMKKRLGANYAVLNQGVGGWTTWQIKKYTEQKIDVLQPDYATLYVGHNDLLTNTPLPYEQLYSAWKNDSPFKSVGEGLAQYRLYSGLKHVLLSLRPASRRAAVPLDHAEKNLKRIIDLVKDQGGKVILGGEGLAPDPAPLSGYNDMMMKLAADDASVVYVDTVNRLHSEPPADVYLDDCHLTRRGHEIVSQIYSEAIQTLDSQ